MSNGYYGGITYNAGAADGSKYSVISGHGNDPVNYLTWYDAIRFANWLDNSQVPGSTETGSYTLLGGTPTPSNAYNITRNANAKIFLPSENEWYKAAYYNPATRPCITGFRPLATRGRMRPVRPQRLIRPTFTLVAQTI